MLESKKWRLNPEARSEIAAAYEWYRFRSPETSVRFLTTLYRAFETISRAPQRWPEYVNGTRRFLLHRFPFFIVYVDEVDSVEIVAVAHTAREPGYWKPRR